MLVSCDISLFPKHKTQILGIVTNFIFLMPNLFGIDRWRHPSQWPPVWNFKFQLLIQSLCSVKSVIMKSTAAFPSVHFKIKLIKWFTIHKRQILNFYSSEGKISQIEYCALFDWLSSHICREVHVSNKCCETEIFSPITNLYIKFSMILF